MEEIWKDVLGYEGLYMVSNMGQVKSLEKVVVGKDGRKMFWPGVVLKPGLDEKTGYYHVGLRKKDGKKTKSVHVIVAVAFLGHIQDGGFTHIHHIDGNKTNNRVVNLEIISAREHASHHKTNNSTGKHNIYLTRNDKFTVIFKFRGKGAHIGTYDMLEEAILERDRVAAEIKAGTFVPKPKRTKTSKYRGVDWNKDMQKWRATVKRKHLGYFEDEEEAFKATQKYNRAQEPTRHRIARRGDDSHLS